jgi:hypothetical protein
LGGDATDVGKWETQNCISKERKILKELGINGRIIEYEDVYRNQLSKKDWIQWWAVRNRIMSL